MVVAAGNSSDPMPFAEACIPEAGTGERLFLSPPASNTRITIPAGQAFEGELVFLGRLPDARSAVLVLDENMPTDNEHSTTPGFRIDIPLSASAA